jgi:hypothetical protein
LETAGLPFTSSTGDLPSRQTEITVPPDAAARPPFFEALKVLEEVRTPGETVGYFVSARTVERPVAVRHYPSYDTIINNQHPNKALVEKALAVAATGIPDTWAGMRVSASRFEEAHYVDSFTNPTLFAHERNHIDTKRYRAHRANDAYLEPEDARSYRRADQIDHSVLHEMNMAHKVQQVVDDELVPYIKLSGYSGLQVITPLIAVIHRETGAKSVIYPYHQAINSELLTNRFNTEHSTPSSALSNTPLSSLSANLDPAEPASMHGNNMVNLAVSIRHKLMQKGVNPHLLSGDSLLLGSNGFGGNLGRLPVFLTGVRHYGLLPSGESYTGHPHRV